MQFAMLLLALLTAACLAGSLLPQGNAADWYREAYPRTAGLILFLRLDHVFRCPWFLVLTALLCLSLILCSLSRFPALLRRTRHGFAIRASAEPPLLEGDEAQARALFSQRGFRRVQETTLDGAPALYAAKNKAGIWGAWLCHLGILLIIIGFGFGQQAQFETSVYGIPGDTLPVEGTDYEVRIDDFSILLRPDGTVDQYVASLTVTDRVTGESGGGTASVNHPLSLFGLKFYQNSTGWGACAAVYEKGELLRDEYLCTGETLAVPGREDLVLLLRAFYPDYTLDAGGKPATASPALNNPAFLYMLYYGGELLGMNTLREGEVITVDDYTFVFHDPQAYTLLQIKRDPFEKLAALGALVLLAALLLAFYVRPAELWAVSDGKVWQVWGAQHKNQAAYRDALLERGRALGLTERRAEDVSAD